VAAGSEAVLIISGAVFTVIDRVAEEAEADGFSESLTCTVKLAVLPAAGMPAIRWTIARAGPPRVFRTCRPPRPTLIGANGFAVGGRSLGWRLRHPDGTRPQGAP
jgi:hypothetical protein